MGWARLQVSTRHLMLFVLVSAVAMWLVRNLWMVVIVGLYLGIVAAYWRAFRDRRRLAWWGFVLASASFNVAVVLACVLLPGLAAYAAIGLAILILLPPAAGFAAAWAVRATDRQAERRRPRWLAWPLVAAACLTPLTMAVDLWPLRLAFRLSSPALEAMADRVAQGGGVTGPRWAGLFRVERSRFDPSTGEVALILTDDRYDPAGFLRLPAAGKPPRSGLYRGLNVDETLDDRWRYQSQD